MTEQFQADDDGIDYENRDFGGEDDDLPERFITSDGFVEPRANISDLALHDDLEDGHAAPVGDTATETLNRFFELVGEAETEDATDWAIEQRTVGDEVYIPIRATRDGGVSFNIQSVGLLPVFQDSQIVAEKFGYVEAFKEVFETLEDRLDLRYVSEGRVGKVKLDPETGGLKRATIYRNQGKASAKDGAAVAAILESERTETDDDSDDSDGETVPDVSEGDRVRVEFDRNGRRKTREGEVQEVTDDGVLFLADAEHAGLMFLRGLPSGGVSVLSCHSETPHEHQARLTRSPGETAVEVLDGPETADDSPGVMTDGGVDHADSFAERDIIRPRFGHCIHCGESFTYDTSDVPTGIEPSYCRICEADQTSHDDPPVIENWLAKDDADLSTEADRIRRDAQRAHVNGGDPLDPLRESDGSNELKRREADADGDGLMLNRFRDRVRRCLVAGIAPFTDPRNLPESVRR